MEQKQVLAFVSTFGFLQNFKCLPAIDEMFLKLIEADWSMESLDTNKVLLTTFLRSNYSVRSELKHYQELLDMTLDYFDSNGVEANELLVGLVY